MNCIPVEILPIAREDVDNALITIAADDPAAANRLLDELLATLDQISRFPLSAPEVMVGNRRVRRYYRVPVRHYNIYYRIVGEKIIAMRVLHERMDAPRHLP
jgi:toxin ParE1/3/4